MPIQSASHFSDLVLVAVMPNQRDLEIARLLGWYRIPLKSAPKVISVELLSLLSDRSLPARGALANPLDSASSGS